MKLDGQLERAQLEEIGSASPSPTPRSRIYSDIVDTSKPLPRFYDGSKYVQLQMRKMNYTTVTTTAAVSVNHEIVFCDATSAAFTATLPAAASMPGEVIYLQKTDTTFNAVTVHGNGAETIDGNATTPLSTYLEWIRIISNGTGWVTIGSGYYQGKTSFTPTGSWSTNTTYTGYWWRTGNRISMEIKIATAGAPTSASLTVNMPTGTTVASSVMAGTSAGLTPFPGSGACVDSGVDQYLAFIFYSSTSAVAIRKDDGDATFSDVTQAAPFTFGAADSVQFTVLDIPVANWRG